MEARSPCFRAAVAAAVAVQPEETRFPMVGTAVWEVAQPRAKGDGAKESEEPVDPIPIGMADPETTPVQAVVVAG